MECSGLIRGLSKETQHFVFSAVLAAELFPWIARDTDARMPTGVDLGVLLTVVRYFAWYELKNYLEQNPAVDPPVTNVTNYPQLNLTPLLQAIGLNIHKKEDEEQDTGVPIIEDLFSGQTAMMGSLSQIEKAQRELLEKGDKVTIDECKATLRDALGPKYDELAESTREFLLAAEYGYIATPTSLDFSSVIVNFTKAFEFELLRVLEPSMEDLQGIADRDPKFMNALSKFTLGNWSMLLRNNRISIEPLFRKRGLVCRDICEAISAVNREKMTKHSARRTKAEATSFRTLFLGSDSICAVFRSTR